MEAATGVGRVGVKEGGYSVLVEAGDCSGNFSFSGHYVQSFREGVSGKILGHLWGPSWSQIFTRMFCCDLVLAQGVQGRPFPPLAFYKSWLFNPLVREMGFCNAFWFTTD